MFASKRSNPSWPTVKMASTTTDGTKIQVLWGECDNTNTDANHPKKDKILNLKEFLLAFFYET